MIPELLLEEETPGKLGGWQPITTPAIPARSLTNWESTPKQGNKLTVLFIHLLKDRHKYHLSFNFLLSKYKMLKHTANRLFQVWGKNIRKMKPQFGSKTLINSEGKKEKTKITQQFYLCQGTKKEKSGTFLMNQMVEVTKETCYVHVFQCRKAHPLSANKPLLLIFTQLCRSRRRMRIMLSQALFSFLTILQECSSQPCSRLSVSKN